MAMNAVRQDKIRLLAFIEHTDAVRNALVDETVTRSAQGFSDPYAIANWQAIARSLERGGFDGLFFADSSGINDVYRGSKDDALRYGVAWPRHDPVATIAVMAAATRHLGFAVTISMSTALPYATARQLSSLDYLTDGRVGWNIVTGNTPMEYAAAGIAPIDHDRRYDRADEFMEICWQAWRGIPTDAIVLGARRKELAVPGKVGSIDFEGDFFRSRGVPLVLPSRQGRPVLFQAGSSGRGQQFAMKHADVLFSIQPDGQSMSRYVQQVRAASAQSGRAEVPVMFGLQVVVASTEAEARRLNEELEERLPLEASLVRLSGSLGIDLSQFDLDAPIEELPTQASQGMMKAMTSEIDGRRRTIREIVSSWAVTVGTPSLVGTPEHVATEIERLWRQTHCLGFNIRPHSLPGGVDDFVDQVVPVLRERELVRKEYDGASFSQNLGLGTAA